MRRIETLKDRTKIIIKYFTHQDLSRMIEFYSTLLSEDDAYLKINSQHPNTDDLRNGTAESANIIRIIAIHEDDMLADGTSICPHQSNTNESCGHFEPAAKQM